MPSLDDLIWGNLPSRLKKELVVLVSHPVCVVILPEPARADCPVFTWLNDAFARVLQFLPVPRIPFVAVTFPTDAHSTTQQHELMGVDANDFWELDVSLRRAIMPILFDKCALATFHKHRECE